MALSVDDLDAIETRMTKALAKGLSNIGLGADDEAEVTARREDFTWLRHRRLTAQSFAHGVVKSVASGLGISLLLGLLYVLTHAPEVLAFVIKLNGGGK